MFLKLNVLRRTVETDFLSGEAVIWSLPAVPTPSDINDTPFQKDQMTSLMYTLLSIHQETSTMNTYYKFYSVASKTGDITAGRN